MSLQSSQVNLQLKINQHTRVSRRPGHDEVDLEHRLNVNLPTVVSLSLIKVKDFLSLYMRLIRDIITSHSPLRVSYDVALPCHRAH